MDYKGRRERERERERSREIDEQKKRERDLLAPAASAFCPTESGSRPAGAAPSR